MTDENDNLDESRLVTVAERPTEVAAAIIVSVLKDAGIRAISTGGFTAGFRAEAPGTVRVQTFEKDAEKARKILDELQVDSPEDWNIGTIDDDAT